MKKVKRMIGAMCGIMVLLSLSGSAYAGEMNPQNYSFEYYGTNDKPGKFNLEVNTKVEVENRKSKQEREFIISLDDKEKNVIEYKFDILEGGFVSFALDGYGKKDDSFVIFDEGGRLIGYTNILKAVDNSGKEVKSDISVERNVIKQKFDNNLNIEDITIDFQVNSLQNTAARAGSFSQYFTKSEWISRADGILLSLYPIYAFPTNSALYAAWDTVVSKHKNDKNWSNEAGMKNQFHCHNDFASSKRPWNLEPWRPNVSYAATVAAGCNPQ